MNKTLFLHYIKDKDYINIGLNLKTRKSIKIFVTIKALLMATCSIIIIILCLALKEENKITFVV